MHNCLADGVWTFGLAVILEPFAWIDKPQDSYAWVDKSPGLVGFALTSLPPSTAASLPYDITIRIQQQCSDNYLLIKYSPSEPDIRARSDGVRVKWESRDRIQLLVF
ncbi:hypothetical protein MMC28_009038 [Mycoblastus sanguinarius]|nr:hypothetical protein [Mycoblastus sanguinarius]